MTTPQADLYRILEAVRNIERHLLGDEDHVDIRSSMNVIGESLCKILDDQANIQAQMALIIKLLSKSDSHGS